MHHDVCFRKALAELHPPIEIMGIQIDPVEALKALHPEYYASLEAEWVCQEKVGLKLVTS